MAKPVFAASQPFSATPDSTDAPSIMTRPIRPITCSWSRMKQARSVFTVADGFSRARADERFQPTIDHSSHSAVGSTSATSARLPRIFW